MCERRLSGKAGGGERAWEGKGREPGKGGASSKVSASSAGCWAAGGHTAGQEVGGLVGHVPGRHPPDSLPSSMLSDGH